MFGPLPVAFGNTTETEDADENIMMNKPLVFLLLLDMQERFKNGTQMLYNSLPKFWVDYHTLI